MSTTTQTYQNHAKFVPLFHFVLLPILLINVFVSGYQVWRQPGLPAGWAVVVSVVLIFVALFARVFALKAQDRVIRLEERLRMRELLPPGLQARIDDFTVDQFIALRFASDTELPELAAAVLRDNIQQRDAIKKMVKHWRADHCRL
jgi:hypothetical protein